MTMNPTLSQHALTVAAGPATLAWLNAFLATSQDDDNHTLYRNLSVEFFEQGVQFVGCDGTLLFRTWAPCVEAPMPLIEEAPNRSVVVMDHDKFALAFMRTLNSASKEENEYAPLVIAIEPAPVAEVPLGNAFTPEMLTLSALGQQLHCRLYEGAFPDWRRLQFGVDARERVDGMRLATRMFATVGKLRGVLAVNCEFSGVHRQINIHATGPSEVRGLMMPMRRAESETANV